MEFVSYISLVFSVTSLAIGLAILYVFLKSETLKGIILNELVCERIGHKQVLNWNTLTDESTMHCSRCKLQWERG